jgi:hypothetical protein
MSKSDIEKLFDGSQREYFSMLKNSYLFVSPNCPHLLDYHVDMIRAIFIMKISLTTMIYCVIAVIIACSAQCDGKSPHFYMLSHQQSTLTISANQGMHLNDKHSRGVRGVDKLSHCRIKADSAQLLNSNSHYTLL